MSIHEIMTAATVKLFERSTNAGLKDDFPHAPAAATDVIAALDARLSRKP